MNSECRIQVVSWLYIIVGTVGIIELIVGLFATISQPLVQLYFFSENVAVLFLPLGLGLRRRIELCRKLALIVSSLTAIIVLGVTLLLVAALFIGSGTGESGFFFEIQGRRDVEASVGDSIVRAAVALLIIAPLCVWQFRVLYSDETRQLTRGRVA